MAREIERKFLVRDADLPRGALAHGVAMTQGYLAYDPSIRVRLTRDEATGAERAYLNIKGPGMIDRAEFEYDVPVDDARALLGLCHAALTKVRYHVPVGGHRWDLDRFTGAHAGLWLAEVELASADEAFERPGWLGDEVSLDKRYTNGALARAGRAP
jgi:adenylate cyclase